MSRLLPIGITAFIIASLAIFLFGDSGLAAFRSMSQYERNLSGNVEDLEQRNAELQARLRLLKTDRESIIIMARGIGMYEPGDMVVKLPGRSQTPPLYAMGDLLRMRKADSARNAVFKEIALLATLVFLLLALVAARLARKREKQAYARFPGSANGNGSARIRSALLMQKIRPVGSVHGTGRR